MACGGNILIAHPPSLSSSGQHRCAYDGRKARGEINQCFHGTIPRVCSRAVRASTEASWC